ncbi:Mss4-like protein [Neohortaea acidophila]|uniref:Mss4-like protein n=1 Tax=Neohortaea acidophila TaxID=245834 RepID=A0A6A6PMI1_9PEZI|nr:Mss4-like protein [Neohortaea acidophila]KAF2480854.1 Mss4-like protein [Neohortaea acidophila]
MSNTITGGCNCGRYTYTIPKPDGMNLCHCIDCRKWAGAMHSAHLFVKTADITQHAAASTPAPRTHSMQGESGNTITRAWCDECGCGLWIKPSTKPDMTCLKGGLFRPHEIPNPTMENWLRNKEPWETPAKGTQRTSDVQ